MFALLAFLLAPAALGLRTSNPALLVIPQPQHISASGPSLALRPTLTFHVANGPPHPYLSLAWTRFTAKLAALYPGVIPTPLATQAHLAAVNVSITHPTEVALGESTDYSYSLQSSGTTVLITARTVYGSVYALETLSQLIHTTSESGSAGLFLVHSQLSVQDAPNFAWRGLMIDSGRRFFPLTTVTNLLDTMLAVKLNVLHLHASDECRWSVESKLFPNLTASLSGVLGGFYTQEDIGTMIAYAQARGIRVVPEFDIPSHSRGLRPIKSEGVVFCSDAESQSQVYGDPANSTLKVLTSLFTEMASLFPDEVFHIGADETSALGPCTVDSTFALERTVLNYLETTLNKTAAGWEEVLFDAGAATNKTVVYAWSRHTPNEIISQGRRSVDSVSGDFYMTSPAPPYPGGWKNFYYDITTGVEPSNLPSLLGGEMSMWTDTYCSPVEAGGQQCGASGGPPSVGAPLFAPERDAEWEKSVGGMMFPRGFVGAMAFWNYNSTIDSQSPDFVSALWDLNDRIISAGGSSCPSQCHCDQLTSCGAPYIPLPPPGPPAKGSILETFPLTSDANQQWTFTSGGPLQLTSNTALCALNPGDDSYPMTLGDCAGAPSFVLDAATGNIKVPDGQCLDVRESDGNVGVWECGTGTVQPNQSFKVEADGRISVAVSGMFISAA